MARSNWPFIPLGIFPGGLDRLEDDFESPWSLLVPPSLSTAPGDELQQAQGASKREGEQGRELERKR